MSTLREDAQSLHEQLAPHLPDDCADEYDVDALEALFDSYVNTYRVPKTQAFDSVRGHVLKEVGIDTDAFWADQRGGEQGTIDEPLPLAECTTDNEWVTIRAKVVDLWEPQHESIHQVGLIGDESGRLKFTAWAKSSPPTLKEDTTYTFKDVVVEEYEGSYSVKINSRSEIIEHADNSSEVVTEVGTMTTTHDGFFVAIQGQSGLIKRCSASDCTRVVTGGECSEHGAVDGKFDLRIKAVIDDGHTAQECLFTRGVTEETTEIDLGEAKEMAADTLDFTVVSDHFTDLLIGRRFTVEGPLLGRYLLVDEVSETPERAFSDGYQEAVVELLAEHNYDGPGLTAASIEDLPRSYDAQADTVGGD
jgi:replication factor A1